ncbi:FG-GAP repeat domain-containing protein [Thalassoglobus neptunius]|uniref:FG-GAP repeat domain-containing protein n=1 Tax=Thalassoglobus neptunius TaxID=1938619 RepID=UPI0011B4758F|nr:VCBS repeat-containing protein [Thalassoglobus neptunius]
MLSPRLKSASIIGENIVRSFPEHCSTQPSRINSKHSLWIRSLTSLLFLGVSFSASGGEFSKQQLTDRYYCDGVDTGDINGDGHIDIVAGPFWYEGPEFTKANEFYEAVPLPPEESPSNSMSSFVSDFNGDGRPDILVLGRVHKHSAYWYENPGEESGLWPRHFVFERVRGESPVLIDMNQDGTPELVTHWDGKWGFLKPDSSDPRAPWGFSPIGDNEDWPQFYHGQGVGDLNNDGRLDYVINDGWYEQPTEFDQPWPFHRMLFSTDRGGAQMGVFDVDGDGDSDVVSAINAHEWGLA